MCPRAQKHAEADCQGSSRSASVQSCECNERVSPPYAEIAYSCAEPPRSGPSPAEARAEEQRQAEERRRAEEIARRAEAQGRVGRKVYGSAGERCSTMCPRAQKHAEADCQGSSRTSSVKSCECNERVSPPYAEIAYSCSGIPRPGPSPSETRAEEQRAEERRRAEEIARRAELQGRVGRKIPGSSGERCSTMCPRAQKHAEADCQATGRSASVQSCECNERVSPPYAEIAYSCSGTPRGGSTPAEEQRRAEERRRAEEIARRAEEIARRRIGRKIYGSPGERCSTMCPRAQKHAEADCQESRSSASVQSCQCTEGGSAPYAEIAYSCSGGAAPGSSGSSAEDDARARIAADQRRAEEARRAEERRRAEIPAPPARQPDANTPGVAPMRQTHQPSYSGEGCRVMAELHRGADILALLSVCTKRVPYWGERVTFVLENLSDVTFYSVSHNKGEVRFSEGAPHQISESMFGCVGGNTVAPGGVCRPLQQEVDSGKASRVVTNVQLATPMVFFALEKGGRSVDWARFGQVVVR